MPQAEAPDFARQPIQFGVSCKLAVPTEVQHNPMKTMSLSGLCAALLLFPACARADEVALSALDLSRVTQDWNTAQADKSVEGHPLSIGGQVFARGVGTHANSSLFVDLHKTATRFSALVGVDDEKKNGNPSVEFLVVGDGKLLWRSGVMKGGEVAKRVDVGVTGVRTLSLQVADADDGIGADHGDWADARIFYSGLAPVTIPAPPIRIEILTPKAAPTPRINGPSVFGARPGSSFAFSIPATGVRPMTFSAKGLPAGLKLDAYTGRISGVARTPGETKVVLRAKNALGTAQKQFRIVIGDKIALTPPLGWNSWNCWGGQVDQAKVLRSARALVASGLNQHGWIYINIDDTWQGARGGTKNAIQPDPDRFPDMKGLADEVHGMGLKIGIYSTPWVTSYAHRIGGSSQNPEGKWDASTMTSGGSNPNILSFGIAPYHFARADAGQWAAWGMDYLKYDWAPVTAGPAQEMDEALRATGRDIVLSLSNNGPGTLLGEINQVAPHAQSWRTTDDINDSWSSMSGIGFSRDAWAPFSKPGQWNDADMLVVGHVGWGNPHPTKLSPDEQYTHISLWSLLASPLLIGCDLEKLDDFTLSLLSNDEVLEVDQDPLGKQATRVSSSGSLDVYAKPLEDGSVAVGLFNRGPVESTVSVKWSDLGLKNPARVRDLWRQKDLGPFATGFQAPVARHGVVLIRVFPRAK